MRTAGRFAGWLLAAVMVVAGGGQALAHDGEPQWYKGNIHAHTTNSDGKLAPEEVALWYRENGYNFLSLTDHRKLTNIEDLRHVETDSFILIPGSELDGNPGGKPAHTNGLFISEAIPQLGGDTMVEAFQRMVDAIRNVGGVAQLNHPNFHWAFGADTIKEVRGARLLEIYNMHSAVNSSGDPANGRPSVEEMWDDVLTSGKVIWGTATDDAHDYRPGSGTEPGKGWLYVRATELTPEAIHRSLVAGDFYSSTGVELANIRNTQTLISFEVVSKPGLTYQTQFIGTGGKVLSTVPGLKAEYRPSGGGYVRTRVRASDGTLCLLQPVFLR